MLIAVVMQHSFFSALEFHSQSSPMLGRWEILGGKVDTSSLYGRTIPMDLVLRLVQWRKAAGMSRKSRICMGLEPGLPRRTGMQRGMRSADGRAELVNASPMFCQVALVLHCSTCCV